MSNENSKIDNLRILARRGISDGKVEEALDYYKQLLIEDPNDGEAYFHTTTFGYMMEFYNCDLATMVQNPNLYSQALEENKKVYEQTKGCIKKTFKMLKDKNPNNLCQEELEVIYEQLCRISGLTRVDLINAVEAFSADPEWVMCIPLLVNEYVAHMMKVDSEVFFDFGTMASDLFKNEDMAYKAYSFVKDWTETYLSSDYYPFLDSNIQRIINHYDTAASKLQKPIREKKVKKFWKTHPEKKKELDEKKKDLHNERKELQSQIESIKSESKYNDFVNSRDRYAREIQTYQENYKTLGLFKRKEKQDIQEKINQNKILLNEVEEIIETINKEIDPIEKDLEEVRNKINKVDLQFKELEDEALKDA